MTIAFQYTVREDDKFPTGLVSTDLTTDAPGAEGMDRVGRRAVADRPSSRVDLRLARRLTTSPPGPAARARAR